MMGVGKSILPRSNIAVSEGQKEQFFTCPYCWEHISMVFDLSQEEQSFIEDCEVCCHPILIRFAAIEGALKELEIQKAQ